MNNEPKVYSLKELFSAGEKREKELEKIVFLRKGYIVLNIKYEYEIQLSRCDTVAKILDWCLHLTQKTWMTTEYLHRFLELVLGYHNIDVYGEG